MGVKTYPALVSDMQSAQLKISFANGVLSPVHCRSSVPSVAALNEADAVDREAGWPSSIVAKARAKRAGQSLLWVAPNVLHFGTSSPPMAAIFGSEVPSWIAPTAKGVSVRTWVEKWGGAYTITNPIYGNYNYRGRKVLGVMTDTELALECLQDATGIRLPPGETVATWQDYPGNQYGMQSAGVDAKVHSEAIKAALPAGHCAVAVRFDLPTGSGAPGGANASCSVRIVHTFPATGLWTGVTCILFTGPPSGSPSSGISYVLGTTNDEAVLSRFEFRPIFMQVDENWKEILRLLGRPGSDTFSWNTANDATRALLHTDVTVFSNVIATPTDPAKLPIPGLSRVSGWGGPSELGIHVYKLYACGLPEFAYGLTVYGSRELSEVGGSHVMVVNDEKRMFSWSGQILADLEEDKVAKGEISTVSSVDVAAMRTLLVRSTSLKRMFTAPTDPLKQTITFAKAQKAGYDLMSEVMIPAEGAQPAVTFGQANSYGSGQQSDLWHQVARADVDVELSSIKSITFTGTPGNYVATARTSLGNNAVVVTDAEIARLIATGTTVINSTGQPLVDVYLDALGLATVDIKELADTAAVDEFAEAAMQQEQIFDPSLLKPNHLGGYITMAFVRSRKQLSQVVVAFLASSRLAKKKFGL